jgi:uncharacterized protein
MKPTVLLPALWLPMLLATGCHRSPPPSAGTSTTPPAAVAAPVAAADTTPGPFAQVSFDCAKATDMTEQMVCADPELAQLDGRLAAAYARAGDRPGTDKATLSAAQNGWIKRRNDCWQATDRRHCVLESYETRLVELVVGSGEVVAPAPVQYACGPDNKPFTAVFYNQLDPKSAVLTYGGDARAIVFAEPSGSGAKYGRDGISFWEHQGEATVSWYGREFKCTAPQAAASAPG